MRRAYICFCQVSSATTDPPIAEIELAMVRLRRSMTKRTLGRLAARELADPPDLALVSVVDAVEEGGDVSVGTVAERLGVDPSRASRLVARSVAAGYVVRVASQHDGRRSGLRLTDAGAAVARAAHAFRRERFAAATQAWSASERREFARLLRSFVDALGEATPPPRTGPA